MADFTKKTPPHEGRMVVTPSLRVLAAALLNEVEFDDRDLEKAARNLVDGTLPVGTLLSHDHFYILRLGVIRHLKEKYGVFEYNSMAICKPYVSLSLEDWLNIAHFESIDDHDLDGADSEVNADKLTYVSVFDTIGFESYEV